jgi:predicted enzyme related to lactoylglutathione lyase
MIRGLHGLFYTSDPEGMRAFLRDKLRLPHTDVGEGWLIFDLPEADLGVHPVDESGRPPSGTHDVSFYCDDIQGTVADLKSRGVTFDHEVADHGYGFVTYFTMPGGVRVQLYEPKYQKRTASAPRKAARKAAAKTKSAAKKVVAKAKGAAKKVVAKAKGAAKKARSTVAKRGATPKRR